MTPKMTNKMTPCDKSVSRRTNNSQPTQRRQRASVTEVSGVLLIINDQIPVKSQKLKKHPQYLKHTCQVLNVDMVDRGLCFTATNIDCSLDMELQDTSRGESDQV